MSETHDAFLLFARNGQHSFRHPSRYVVKVFIASRGGVDKFIPANGRASRNCNEQHVPGFYLSRTSENNSSATRTVRGPLNGVLAYDIFPANKTDSVWGVYRHLRCKINQVPIFSAFLKVLHGLNGI